MKVLIIPEDPTRDQYILKPVVEYLFRSLQVSTRVEVLLDPHLRGIHEALDPKKVKEIIEENPMVDLFLLIVDRDCNRYKNENKARARQEEHAGKLIATCACQEVEVWMLALHWDELPARWPEIREECDPKERFVEPFLAEKGWAAGVGQGRKRAMRKGKSGLGGLLQVCPEIAALQGSIQEWLQQRAAS